MQFVVPLRILGAKNFGGVPPPRSQNRFLKTGAGFLCRRAGNGGKRENPVFAFWATGRQLGASGGPLGASGGPLGARGGPLGACGGPQGGHWAPGGPLLAHFGALWPTFSALWRTVPGH